LLKELPEAEKNKHAASHVEKQQRTQLNRDRFSDHEVSIQVLASHNTPAAMPNQGFWAM
jgi:hypothetical protein